ncbi:MAG TPA: methionyl-tRNA formyltransferase [Vicinamibacterales bacterium]|nr:methionyl-tRNA formyltransferase [Vicinamibacterales bacterium]HPW22120.1 methionyl-tRNA formyltransferase [Vicinamibacterales bacterium]
MASRSLRAVFFGTPEFAVPSLEALLASRHAVVGAVTQPDRPRGRGQRVSDSPVKRVAAAAGVPVLQPERLKDPAFLEHLRGLQADVGVVAAYGKILPAAVLDLPPLGLVNVHASLLPRYRGAAPIHRAVMAGDAETGVSIMRVVEELDAGPVFSAAAIPIGPDETSEELERSLAGLGARLLLGVIEALASTGAVATPQDESAATCAARLRKEEGVIDWTAGAGRIHDQVRGLHPWPLAWTWLRGKRVIVIRTRRVQDAPSSTLSPGHVVSMAGDALRVQCGSGQLDILLVRPEGRRAMAARDFASGYAVTPGSRFDTPSPPGSSGLDGGC